MTTLQSSLLTLVTEKPRTPAELRLHFQVRYTVLLPHLEHLRTVGLLCRRMTPRGAIWAVRRLPEARSARVEAYTVIIPAETRLTGSWWTTGASPEANRNAFSEAARAREKERQGEIRR